MTIRKILTEPDPILKKISVTVDTVGIEEQRLMDDMLETRPVEHVLADRLRRLVLLHAPGGGRRARR